jgi:hypothetical protein
MARDTIVLFATQQEKEKIVKVPKNEESEKRESRGRRDTHTRNQVNGTLHVDCRHSVVLREERKHADGISDHQSPREVTRDKQQLLPKNGEEAGEREVTVVVTECRK